MRSPVARRVLGPAQVGDHALFGEAVKWVFCAVGAPSG